MRGSFLLVDTGYSARSLHLRPDRKLESFVPHKKVVRKKGIMHHRHWRRAPPISGSSHPFSRRFGILINQSFRGLGMVRRAKNCVG
jgi:hypothetical protein